MKKVLVLGAGLVSGPLVRYLLAREDVDVTVASRRVERAEAIVGGHAYGKAVALDAGDASATRELVSKADLCISLLPPAFHADIARLALEAGKHFVTTSYVSEAMNQLDEGVRRAGLSFLNEVGLDPGIDHMSALRIIHRIQNAGGAVTSFRSYCGGLPAPEANTNPWGYKFSWSPRGVVLAGRNSARWLESSQTRTLPGERLFSNHWLVDVRGFGELEAYYNRDSLPYIESYGLKGVEKMLRATLRYPGWSFTMQKLADLDYFGLQELAERPRTYGDLTRALAHIPADADLRSELASTLGVDPSFDTMMRMDWLGLLDDRLLPDTAKSPLDSLAALMLEKMPFHRDERDLCVMQHEIEGTYPSGERQQVTSTLVEYGQPGGDSAMARTVGLPAAIAAAMILDGRISDRGVLVPVLPSIYEPILDELTDVAGIAFTERITIC
jgi:saccharopine dehydrogenase (NADP+, L-glutamate forming)